MSKGLLKGIINFLGILSILLFLMTTFDIKPIKNLLTSQKYAIYGELTEINRIADFKVEMPPKRKEYFGVPIQQADVICFGDSYFNHVRFKNVPEGIHEKLDVPVSFIKQENPFPYLAKNKYPKGTGQLLIYETTERLIPHRFSKPFTQVDRQKGMKSKIKKWDKAIFDKEMDYTYLLKSSVLTEGFYARLATFKFRNFGYISAQTKPYDVDKQLLFFGPTTGATNKGFYYQHSEEELNLYADNIQHMAHQVKVKYDLEFVFLPIPNKYTIYSKLVNDDVYNNFLPNLYRELEERNISYINLYEVYKNHPDLLYHTTDSHWNEQGKDVCLDLLVEKIEVLGVLE